MAKAEPGLTHRNLPLLLLLAREAVMAHFRPVLNAHGLTEQQWRILRVLVGVASLEPRQIVRLCGISSPSLAGILARMASQGLISRAGVAHDRRRQAVSATAKGRQLAARMAPEIDAVYAELAEKVGKDGLGRLYATLDALMEALGNGDPRAVPADRADSPPAGVAKPA